MTTWEKNIYIRNICGSLRISVFSLWYAFSVLSQQGRYES